MSLTRNYSHSSATKTHSYWQTCVENGSHISMNKKTHRDYEWQLFPINEQGHNAAILNKQ